MVSHRNSGCLWPAPRPATSSSERSRRRAMGRPSCSKVSALRALAGSRELSPQRDPWEDRADECLVPEHPAPLPGHPARSGAVRSPWWEAALASVTLAVANGTIELPAAPYDHQQCLVLLRDLVYTSNGTRPQGELNGSKLTRNLCSRSLCFQKGDRKEYT